MASDRNNRPEDFLELVERSRRGRLKVYIGFAAGVGKTYRMLQDAQALKARGGDVAVGLVETHGRSETAALLAGLEQIPLRSVAYRGVSVQELDLDAILARRPNVVLIDEIAHTNAPGSKNRRRYQDVLDVLAAGINVLSAFNVQHLESLNDLIYRNTGVLVRETVPDVFLKQADQVVSVDLAVPDLLERLTSGRIYPAERIDTALQNFFRPENLSALRELALREVAGNLDRSNGRAELEQPERKPSPSQRVMVCMASSSPRTVELLRRGSRMAGRYNTDWFVVYVQTPSEAPHLIDAESQRHLLANIAMARELGAEVVRIEGDDPAVALIEFAHQHGIAHVVIGRSTASWWRRVSGRSVMSRMVRMATDLDLHILALEHRGVDMSLRQKLLLAQLPLIATLVVIGGISIRQTHQLGLSSAAILKDNYRSVLAAERMKEALERLDSAAVFRALGQIDLAANQARENRPRFEQELSAQEHNITEVGEAEATARLVMDWKSYLDSFERFSSPAAAGPLQRTYFEEMKPGFQRVKDDLDVVLGINEDAMVRKSDAAHAGADHLDNLLRLATVLALLLGTAASSIFTARLLKPLVILASATRRIGEGDLEARASLRGRDEVASLGRELNQMAERLRQYRESSLGELLLAQTASQAAIDGLPDVVLIFNTEGALLSSNEAAARLLRIEQGGALQPLAQAPPAAREVIERLRTHVLTGKGAYQPKGLEEAIRLEAADGPRYLLPRASPVHAEGQLRGAAVILQDVTRLQRFDELTNNLVATVAHELRTPLTSLRMAIHLCLEGAAGPITEKQADLLFAARQDCERLQTMVDDLLDLSRLQSGREQLELAPVRVSKLLDEARDAQLGLAADQDVIIATGDLTAGGEVRADEERLRLVFSNLVVNAIRHSPRGGSVSLRARPNAGFVRFEVSDQGTGIPVEYRLRVFEKFFRLPGAVGPGAGLGLYIAREIVLAHKGEIGVESEPERGSTFWFTLPTT